MAKIEGTNVKRVEKDKRKKSRRGGYLYVLRCGDSDYYKIGMCYTDAVQNRIATLQPGCPGEIQLVCLRVCEAYLSYCESVLHYRYRRNHVYGEWFEFTEEEMIKVRKSFYSVTGKD